MGTESSFCAFHSLGVGHMNGIPGGASSAPSSSRVTGSGRSGATGGTDRNSARDLSAVWCSPHMHHPIFVSCFIELPFCAFTLWLRVPRFLQFAQYCPQSGSATPPHPDS